MNFVFQFFLLVHIAGGAVGLITGGVNMVAPKGNARHKQIGRIFFWGMLSASLSALAMSAFHPAAFLFAMGVFTFYMVGTGYRYVYLRMLGQDAKPILIDWALTVGMAIAGVSLVVWGAVCVSDGVYFGIAYLVFGIIGLSSVRKDLNYYRGREYSKLYWLAAHLQRMVGAYIAGLTAFLVVNSKYSPIKVPPLFTWLLPTVVFTPLIFVWTAKYAGKPNKKAS
jgi:uncharacterized membrane protein